MAPRLPFAAPVDQAVVGPIARSAHDLDFALRVIAGPDALDDVAYRLQLPPPKRTHVRDFRILVLDQHPLGATSSSIADAVGRIATLLESQGASVARGAANLPDLADLCRVSRALLMALMAADMDASSFADAVSNPATDADSQSITMRHRDWVRLDRERLSLQAKWLSLFAEFDVLICPATPVTAFPHDERPMQERRLVVDGVEAGYDILPLWSLIANPTGLPSTTIPVGLDPLGLPVGMQIVGAPYGDPTTLSLAKLLEQEVGRFAPPVAASHA
jgi:amidase